MALGTGVTTPVIRTYVLDDSNADTFVGNVTKGLDVAEVQTRLVTGADLFVPSDADGMALGAGGGTAWAVMPVAVGGGLSYAEARLVGPYSSNAGAGLVWTVKFQAEVRNA